MNRKNVSIALGIVSFIMMICGFLGYLYHVDCCGLKRKCAGMKNRCGTWKPHCCKGEEA